MIDEMNIAKTDMTWHGIKLNKGDLYGHETWHGDIYCHAPASPNFIHFTDLYDGHYSVKPYELPSNIHYYEGADENMYFEEALDLTEQTVQRLFDEAMDTRR